MDTGTHIDGSTGDELQTGNSSSDILGSGHEESLEAIHELAQQVEAAEAAAGAPVPSQAGAQETAGTGI